MNSIPKIPLAKWTDVALNWATMNYQDTTKAISDFLKGLIVGLQDSLIAIPPELVIIIVALLAWWLAGKRIALFSLVGLAFIYNIQLWDETMQTIAMVIAAVALCMIIGVPLGILSAKNQTAHRIITPILDFMQTLPAFVYLLPAIPFFGLGVVPAVITTLIFAMPPIIRLTDLGIKQVPEELVELGKSFGSTFFQMLFKIELPLARSLKENPARWSEIFPVILPVCEKMASIVRGHIKNFQVDTVYLVGGTSILPGFKEVLAKELNCEVIRPHNPLLATPLGIAYFCK